jgi:hypothetical protein
MKRKKTTRKKGPARPRALVLLGGGPHSGAVLHYAQQTHDTTALTIKGIEGFDPDIESAKAQAEDLGIDTHLVEEVQLGLGDNREGSFLILLSLGALKAVEIGAKTILVGSREMSPSTCSSWLSLERIFDTIREVLGVELHVVAPFIKDIEESGVLRKARRWGAEELFMKPSMKEPEETSTLGFDLCPDEPEDEEELEPETVDGDPETEEVGS